MRLNTVVLPEPFGPISAVIVPARTPNEQSSTACTPPKPFDRPSTSSRRAHAATSGSEWTASTPIRMPAVATARAVQSASDGRIPRGSRRMITRKTAE